MGNKKGLGVTRIIAVVIAAIFGMTLLFGAVPAFFSSKAVAENTEGVPFENKEVPEEQPDSISAKSKYRTFSQYNNIDIFVNYLSPVNKEKDFLTFDIRIDTHSVDLTKYADITKYVVLRNDAGITILDGFEWTLKSSENHHINGILKVKNDIEGKPFIDSDTKSFSLVFKNVGDTGEREHVYVGDKLE